MAEGGYDPDTENKTPWEDHGIDHDDDDDDDDGLQICSKQPNETATST